MKMEKEFMRLFGDLDILYFHLSEQVGRTGSVMLIEWIVKEK